MHRSDHRRAQPVTAVIGMNNHLYRAMIIWEYALFVILHCFHKCPIPPAFREIFERVFPLERKTVSHRRDVFVFCIVQGKLICWEAIQQFMPEFFCNLIVEHEFGPCDLSRSEEHTSELQS